MLLLSAHQASSSWLGSYISYSPRKCAERRQSLPSELWGACAAGVARAAADGAPGREHAVAGPSQEWTEEREAVEAIHGNDASFPSPSQTLLSLPLPAEAAPLLHMRPEVWFGPAFRFSAMILT